MKTIERPTNSIQDQSSVGNVTMAGIDCVLHIVWNLKKMEY